MKQDLFSSRFGIVMATLGMAIGTGNLWRFPRQVAENGGGAFLIPWMIFLFTWSIPILIAEFTAGKATRRGPIGAFAKLSGKGSAWMGAFMAITSLLIASYYAIVAGWTLSYLVEALKAVIPGMSGGFAGIPAVTDAASIAASKAASLEHFKTLLSAEGRLIPGVPDEMVWQLGCVLLVTLVVWGGVRVGIEWASKIFIPLLFLLLIGASGYILATVDGAIEGVRFLFNPDWKQLAEPKVWMNGLTQSAWSTGAGWGLLLAYGAATRRDADTVTNAKLGGLGNNLASLVGGLFLFPALFGMLGLAGLSSPEIAAELKQEGPQSTGLAFTIVPFLFKGAGEAGPYLTIVFFGGLFLAAITSLISMFEMGTRTLMDMGKSRSGSVWLIAIVLGGLGTLSVWNADLFITLDWSCGIGLLFGGLFLSWSIALYGVERFRKNLINGHGADRPVKASFNYVLMFLIPLQAFGLIGWWAYAAATNAGYFDPNNLGLSAFDPFALGTYGLGPFVFFGGSLLWTLILFSPWIGRASVHGEEKYRDFGDDRPNLWWRLGLFTLGLAALWFSWFKIPGTKGPEGKTLIDWLEARWVSWNASLNGDGIGENSWIAIAGLIGLVLGLNFARQVWIAKSAKPKASLPGPETPTNPAREAAE